MGSNLFVQLGITDFTFSIRDFFAPIVKFVYYLISKSVDLMFKLAGNRFGLGNEADKFADAIFIILVIFMLFKLTIALLNYIVNPDSFLDKTTGVGKMIIRIIVSVVLLFFINPIFDLLYEVQDKIIDNGIIESIILTNTTKVAVVSNGSTSYERPIYEIQMDEHCPSDLKTYAWTKGDALSIMALQPFYTLNYPSEDALSDDYKENGISDSEHKIALDLKELIDDGANGYCGIDFSKSKNLTKKQFEKIEEKGLHSGSKLINHNVYNLMADDSGTIKQIYQTLCGNGLGLVASISSGGGIISCNIADDAIKLTGHEEYVVDFNYVWALVTGFVIFLILVSFMFDVIIRSLTLFLYQIIAPVPIIINMSPAKKDSDALMNWVKKTLGCWASLFIRILILDLAIYFIAVMKRSTLLDSENGLIAQIFIILGTLMFAKKLPKLIEEVVPGLKLADGFKINPFKRVSQDALGGNVALGVGAGLMAGTASGLVNLGHRGAQGFMKTKAEWNKLEDEKGNALSKKARFLNASRAAGRGFAKTVGSTVAGFASAGTRALSKTSKDGKIFTGVKQGHLEAQFAKQQREDLERKGSTFWGRLAADANRWIGRENEAQRTNRQIIEAEASLKAEKDKINREKSVLQNKKDGRTKDYTKIQSYFDELNKRIDSSGIVKDANGNDIKIKDEIEKLELIKNSDYSAEAAERKQAIKDKYAVSLSTVTNNSLKQQLINDMNKELSEVSADSVKQEHYDAQNKKIKNLRTDFINKVVADKEYDSRAYQIYENIENSRKEIKNNLNNNIADRRKELSNMKKSDGTNYTDTEINDKIKQEFRYVTEAEIDTAFNITTANGDYNRGAVYDAQDIVSNISDHFNKDIKVQDELLYQLNITEQAIAERKTDAKFQAALADNAATAIKGPQPENWLTAGDIKSSSGYSGYGMFQYSNGAHQSGGGGHQGGGHP